MTTSVGTWAESREGPGAPRQRVPDFFIVGSPKTGTTSLHATLKRHPRIFMPHLKEPLFLASDMLPRSESDNRPRERGFPRTLEEYLALFENAKPGQLAGEATTTYLWSRTAANGIADLQPDARIIAILREPASLLRSLHLQFLRTRNEAVEDLREAMSLEAARREGQRIPRHSHRPQLLQYSEHVRYTEQLGRYHARFSPEQILVLIYDDFIADNVATVRRVLQFLDVDDGKPRDAMNLNVTTTVRSWRVKHVLDAPGRTRNPTARAAVRALTTPALRGSLRRTISKLNVADDAPPPDEALMTDLRRRFKPEVVSLSECLDRDLVSLWGYDDIG
jgi:Sulfotransferase family